MKKNFWTRVIILCLLIVSFLVFINNNQQQAPHRENVHGTREYDWIDFIKINDKKYYSIRQCVIADSKYIGKKIGEVEFEVADVVKNSKYKIINGDAAFWDIGTKIYAVKGFNDNSVIAVKDKTEINGYRLYQYRAVDYEIRYEHLSKDKIKKIEIYESLASPTFLRKVKKKDEIKKLIHILDTESVNEHFDSYPNDKEIKYFNVVFYSDDSVAYSYSIRFNGNAYFWEPNMEEEIITKEIENYLKKSTLWERIF